MMPNSTDPEATTDAAPGVQVDAEASTDSEEQPDLCVPSPSKATMLILMMHSASIREEISYTDDVCKALLSLNTNTEACQILSSTCSVPELHFSYFRQSIYQTE